MVLIYLKVCMMNFIKRKKMTIISFSLLMIWGISTLLSCKNDYIMSKDPLIMYFYLFTDKNLFYLETLAPLFVFIPCIYDLNRELSSGFIKYKLTRMNYKTFLIKNYKKALSNIWILPAFFIIMLFLCCLYMNSFSFGSGKDLYGYLSGSPSVEYIPILGTFIFVYFLNLILHSILYVNIGLLYCKKYKNYLVNIILSYITFIGLDIVAEIFIGNLLLAAILNIHNITDSLNLFNIWIYDNVVSLPFSIIYSLILAISSLIILIFIYRNKEGVIIESEK